MMMSMMKVDDNDDDDINDNNDNGANADDDDYNGHNYDAEEEVTHRDTQRYEKTARGQSAYSQQLLKVNCSSSPLPVHKLI